MDKKTEKKVGLEAEDTASVLETAAEDSGVDKETMSQEEYVGFLETELGKTIALSDEFKVTSQRLRADFENYKKRNACLSDDMRQHGQAMVLEELLSVVDNLGRAKEMVKDECSLKGFEIIESEVMRVFEKYGVKEIEADDKDFDAKTMNAVMREENPEKAGKVVQVLSKGYMIGDNVLRHAMVKVAG